MPQLLLELFSEEIPARMQQGAARDLERMASERLKAAGLTYEALTTFAGPRRLTLVVEGLPAATPDREEELKGPRTSAPEQALEGFLRKTGLTKDQLNERDGVWFAVVREKGRPTADLIADMVDGIVRGFPWPKSMRWGSGTLRWIRPLKRIVALFDGHVAPFEIDGIQSGDLTEGHRFMGCGRSFAVRDFADYRAKLESDFVLLDVVDRKLRILEGAQAACAAKGLALVDDDGLLDEVAGLAEWPTPILGDMDPRFLTLPPEVIRLSMKVHQKYFAVRDPQTHGLAPHFVVVANVEATDGGVALAAGNSRVLSARLDDARFFWDEDLKTGFEIWSKKLEGVTFHAKLGTLAERVERIAALAREIAQVMKAQGIAIDPDQAFDAAKLAKADLSSAMVGEFPELQGVMGGYYARAFGHPEAVADAVRDHYKPQGPTDSVPTAPLTVAVALADKLDTLVGFFAIDEKPTGSKDPFALRRAALGVIRLVINSEARMGLKSVAEFAFGSILDQAGQKYLARYPFEGSAAFTDFMPNGTYAGRDAVVAKANEGILVLADPNSLGAGNEDGRGWTYTPVPTPTVFATDLLAFFADRLKVLLRDQGKRHDLVDAVFALGDDDLVRIVRRVEALDGFLATEDGANLLAGYKRASNILKAEEKKPTPLPTGEPAVREGAPAQEVSLILAVAGADFEVGQALDTEDFAAAMRALSLLRAPVDAFFDKVMVNSDVAEERDNRLKLLGQVRAVMGRVADFGQIAG